MSWAYRFEKDARRWFNLQEPETQEDALDLIETLCDHRLPPQFGQAYVIRDWDQTGLFVHGVGRDEILLIVQIGHLADD